jgi:endonuclease YncB( thermonuclease family)
MKHLLIALLGLGALIGCQKGEDANLCQVQQVIDGDSLRLECQGKPVEVRLWCIDAPEYSQGRWGQAATRYLKQLLPKEVRIEVHDQDHYGRTVAEVFSTGPHPANFNLTMVQSGHAAVFYRYCPSSDYARAEDQAKAYRIGIWSKAGLQQRPWDYRRMRGLRGS